MSLPTLESLMMYWWEVPFVPAGELSEPSLPDRENWVTALWISAFKRINNNAKAAFLLANGHCFIEPPSNRAPVIEDMNEKHSEEMQASKTEFKIPDSQAYSSGKNPGTRTPIEINKTTSEEIVSVIRDTTVKNNTRAGVDTRASGSTLRGFGSFAFRMILKVMLTSAGIPFISDVLDSLDISD